MSKPNLWKNNRNFNDDLDEQRYYYVAEHNDLITKARHDLTAKELKIMDFIISKIKPDDSEVNTVFTSMYELSTVMNLTRSGQSYSNMANTLAKLREKTVAILDNGGKRVTLTGWVESLTFEENGQVEATLNKKLIPYLLNLKTHYTQYLLFDTVQLDSKYSILLYKLMRERDKRKQKETPILETTPEELQKQLGSPESYSFGDFNRNVLKPAIEEINLKIHDMNLTVYQGQRGRKVVALEIHNDFYPIQDYVPTEKDVSMINYLEN